MKILIDNLDGLGLIDYTQLVQFNPKSKILRQLNKITSCNFELFIEATPIKVPVRLSQVRVVADDGNTLFSGYVDASPDSISKGAGMNGPIYQFSVNALSGDAAFDSESSINQALLTGQSLQQDWNILGTLITGSPVTIALPQKPLTAGRMNIFKGVRWTQAAAVLAENTRMTYRVDDTGLAVLLLGTTSHMVSADDPGLTFVSSASGLQWLANDVTVCGNEEPTAYVTEIFEGDGATKFFELFAKPFTSTGKQKTSIQDYFQGNSINSSLWLINDPAAHLALTANGLTCEGGSGKDGETTIASTQLIELGGTITLEGTGVQFSSGSNGIILGLYVGIISASTCFAGFMVSSANNSITLTAQINGVGTGEAYVLNAGHIYTLRLKVFSLDVERVEQSYFYSSGAGSAFCGGGVVTSGGQIELSIQDVIGGLPSIPILIHSASIDFIPPTCRLGIYNSGNLVCSLKSLQLLQTAPLQVCLSSNSGTPVSLRIGSTAEGSSCRITSTGYLEFYPDSVPAIGSFIYVIYRAKARAVARRTQSFTTNNFNEPSTITWLGSVVSPSAWSSQDCDNAALALLSTNAGLSTSLKGLFKVDSQSMQKDIWPGDTLSIGPYPDSTYRNATARDVEILLNSNSPENNTYKVEFANEQVEALSLHFSSAVPEDVIIPQQSTTLDKALPSLTKLYIVSVTGLSINLNTGESAPINGGFEVRRRDNTFGLGQDSDLVIRSVTSAISIPRIAAVEQYFLRSYDANVPPNYSLFSAAVFINVTL